MVGSYPPKCVLKRTLGKFRNFDRYGGGMTKCHESSGLRLWLRSRNIRRRMVAEHAEYSIFVLSYPKCGRTWHRALVGFYLVRLLGEDTKRVFDLPYLCRKAGIGGISYSHNGSNPTDHLPLSSSLIASPVEWHDRDVLLLFRDPHDAIVSAYHHVTHRELRFDGTLSQFVRTEVYGIDKYLTALSRWLDNRHLARRFMMISYERLHRDTAGVLCDTLCFIGIRELDEELVAQSVAACTFDRMKDYESKDFFSSDLLRNESGRPEAAKVRRGKVGTGISDLSSADVRIIRQAIERHGLIDFFASNR